VAEEKGCGGRYNHYLVKLLLMLKLALEVKTTDLWDIKLDIISEGTCKIRVDPALF
jgi:hypothetical protein